MHIKGRTHGLSLGSIRLRTCTEFLRSTGRYAPLSAMHLRQSPVIWRFEIKFRGVQPKLGISFRRNAGDPAGKVCVRSHKLHRPRKKFLKGMTESDEKPWIQAAFLNALWAMECILLNCGYQGPAEPPRMASGPAVSEAQWNEDSGTARRTQGKMGASDGSYSGA
jgi:hypothetical protein